MNELFAVLLSWAVTLSGFPAPAHEPEVVTVPHAFFVQNACGGNECRVYGWYAGGNAGGQCRLWPVVVLAEQFDQCLRARGQQGAVA